MEIYFKINYDKNFDFTLENKQDKMDFIIRKNSTLPILRLEPIRVLDYNDLVENISNAAITFSMIDIESGSYRIANKAGYIEINERDNQTKIKTGNGDMKPDFYICYKFTEFDTRVNGVFRGEFKIDFVKDNCINSLIAPIKNDLYIHIIDSITKTSFI
jgi:hypothetical protein